MSKTFAAKTWSVALAAVLAACACIAALAYAPTVAQADNYTYTVRVWGGNQGTVQGQNSKGYAELTGVPYGGVVRLSSQFPVTINNEKYYQKGYRISGQDDLEGYLYNAITVTEDVDYVVSYGVKGDLVSYTVNFVEYGTGRALTNDDGQSSVTYYGNQGDKPVVSFAYISGYRPRYRNITGTLGPDGTNNWTFEYIPLAAGETEDGTGGNNNQGGNQGNQGGNQGTNQGGTNTPATTPANNQGNANNQGGNANQGNAGDNGQNANQGANGNDQNANPPADQEEANEPPATEEILDEDTPLATNPDANTPSESDEQGSGAAGVPPALMAGIIAAIVALLGVLLFLLKRKRDEDEALHA